MLNAIINENCDIAKSLIMFTLYRTSVKCKNGDILTIFAPIRVFSGNS